MCRFCESSFGFFEDGSIFRQNHQNWALRFGRFSVVSARRLTRSNQHKTPADAAHQRWIGRRVTSQAGARLLRALACRRCTWACSHCNRRHLSARAACCCCRRPTQTVAAARRRWLLDSLLSSAQSADYGSGQADTDCLRAQLLSFAPSLCAHGCSARPRGPFLSVA